MSDVLLLLRPARLSCPSWIRTRGTILQVVLLGATLVQLNTFLLT